MAATDYRQVLSDAQRIMELSEKLHLLPPAEAAAQLRETSDEVAARALALLNPAAAIDILWHLRPSAATGSSPRPRPVAARCGRSATSTPRARSAG